LRAFKSHLRRHSKYLSGCTVKLCSRYVENDVTAIVGDGT
jgi:hypothetical protein